VKGRVIHNLAGIREVQYPKGERVPSWLFATLTRKNAAAFIGGINWRKVASVHRKSAASDVWTRETQGSFAGGQLKVPQFFNSSKEVLHRTF